MKKLSFKSFAGRLSLYTISFAIIIFTTVMVLFYTYSREKITDHAIQHTHGLLKNMATQINSSLLTVETTMNQSVWMIEDHLTEPDSLFRIVSAVARNNSFIIGSAIAFEPYYYKEKGKYFMPYAFYQDSVMQTQVLGSKDYDYPCMDWYIIPKLLKQNYWSEPYYDIGGSNMIMTTFSHPMCDPQGNVYAIFTANISLSQFTDMVDSLKPYESSNSFLLSRNGNYITHRLREKIMNETIFSNAFETHSAEYEFLGREMTSGHTGTMKFNDHGDLFYAFYTSIPNIKWSVCNICPGHIILNELDSTSRKIIYLFLAGVISLFIITYCVIKRVVRPLEDFSRSARAIATGRFDVQLPEVTSADEMKTLYDSFVYMQQSLSEYVTELQKTTAIKERIESELQIAREIQMGMIPKIFPPFPERNDIDLHAILKPAKEVGGDLYDFFIDNEKLYFAIGDVSGKGIPASLFMAITRNLFRTLSSHVLSPAQIVSAMNNSISENNESNMFVTLIIGILDLPSGKLKFCNAGHNPPILIETTGDTHYMDIKKNLSVGIIENYPYMEEEIVLPNDSKLFLYTDGATEAENENKELYSEELLLKIITQNATLNVRDMVNTTLASITNHVNEANQSDDLTMLVIHYKSNTQ